MGELARDEADDALLVLRDMLGDAVMDDPDAVDTGDSAGDAVAVDDVLPPFLRPVEAAVAEEAGAAVVDGWDAVAVVEAGVNLSLRYDGTMRMISLVTDCGDGAVVVVAAADGGD